MLEAMVSANLTRLQIIECIPERVRRFLSNDLETPVHTHKSLILNLACGASIRKAQSRNRLFEG